MFNESSSMPAGSNSSSSSAAVVTSSSSSSSSSSSAAVNTSATGSSGNGAALTRANDITSVRATARAIPSVVMRGQTIYNRTSSSSVRVPAEELFINPFSDEIETPSFGTFNTASTTSSRRRRPAAVDDDEVSFVASRVTSRVTRSSPTPSTHADTTSKSAPALKRTRR